MTGPGCFIIINCGLPKGAANGLYAMYLRGNPGMRAVAADLRDELDEVCRFGQTIAIAAVSLDQDDIQKIYELDAKGMRKKIRDYIAKHKADATFVKLQPDGVKLRDEIITFTDKLGQVFEDIVAEYGPQIEAAKK